MARYAPSLVMVAVAVLAVIGVSCRAKPASQRVVIYTSVDEPIARPILDAFRQKTGIDVVIKTDGEATKTSGLAEMLEAEAAHPQADVWWSSEPFHTINIAERHILEPYISPMARRIPEPYKDASGNWTGTGLRMRTIALSAKAENASKVAGVRTIFDLARPSLKGRIAMARPSAGTTGGHVAAIYTTAGEADADHLFNDLKANGMIMLRGNGDVAEQVAAGTMLAGLTDNDDVYNVNQELPGAVKLVAPDPNGALMIPTTVALVARGDRTADQSAAARALIDYLLSPEVENRLVESHFAAMTIADLSRPRAPKPMAVDYVSAARALPVSARRVIDILEHR